MQQTDSIKKVVVNPGTSANDYIPGVINSPSTAYTASIHLLFNHVADFHRIMIKIIANKYGLNEDDIVNTITGHPDYKNMIVNPAIHSLTYFTQADVNIVIPEPIGSIEPIEPIVVPKVRKIKIIRRV